MTSRTNREAGLWDVAHDRLSPYGRLARVETPLTEAGFPDIVYCLLGVAGVLELKRLRAWPVRPTTPLRVPHLTAEQVAFLEGWARAPANGIARMLLQVGTDYLVLDHVGARAVRDGVATRAWLGIFALARGEGAFPTRDAVKALTRRL